jgi:hypothetical protein
VDFGFFDFMWLLSRFRLNPSPWRLNNTYHGLPARMHMHVLDRDLLHALAAVAVERVEQHCERARELPGLVQMLVPQGRSYIAVHGVLEAVHCGIVAGKHLRCEHLFERVFWLDCGKTRRDHAAFLPAELR